MTDFVIAELYNKRDRQTSWEEYEVAKTIKFNLICDKKPVRTIEGLQNKFCIEFFKFCCIIEEENT